MKQVIFSLLCLTMAFATMEATTPAGGDKFSEKVNLALRQVGHQLLQIAGDHESQVPPVEVIGQGEFSLRMEHAFDYDTLPTLLSQALLNFEIAQDYQVAIRQCGDSSIVLGYNKLAFDSGAVACKGRDSWTGCNNIVLTIEMPSQSVPGNQNSIISMVVLLVVLTGFGIYWRRNKGPEAEADTGDEYTALGHFQYDPDNQQLLLDGTAQHLTFRENKLLNYLVNHANEVIPRDTLIAAVWGDEGVIVGRSLDVFISRLRKLLKADETVKIKSVHGVGYRLEV
jgi:hypothetical protein